MECILLLNVRRECLSIECISLLLNVRGIFLHILPLPHVCLAVQKCAIELILAKQIVYLVNRHILKIIFVGSLIVHRELMLFLGHSQSTDPNPHSLLIKVCV
jgi:hypothetical protein